MERHPWQGTVFWVRFLLLVRTCACHRHASALHFLRASLHARAAFLHPCVHAS